MYTLKKSLGQHFLKDENICRKIIAALPEQPHRILEVGPGGGALTKYLLSLAGKDYLAVELDEEKVAYLIKTYPTIKGKLIHQDFLEIEKPFEQEFIVIGNFPYNISSQIVFKILEWKDSVPCMIGMFQKEVAQRIAAKEGNKIYGILSVLVQTFFQVEYLFEVAENCFVPPPKVKSAVLRLTPIPQKVLLKSEPALQQLVKTAFNHRRKTLRNATKHLFTSEVLQKDIFNKRAEQLSVHDFAALTFEMKEN